MNVKYKVDELVKKFGTHNPYELADFLGIQVLDYEIDENIRGAILTDGKNSAVLLNPNLCAIGKFITLCHEIGHHILHPNKTSFSMDENFFIKSRPEKEANLFALHLISYTYDFVDDKTAEEISDRLEELNVPYDEFYKTVARLIEIY